jgi:TRAP-type C4-dicarboxylate transport system permease small subunit
MDITAYPISLFAVYKRKVFNFIIRDLLIFVILVLFIIRTIKKIKKMKDEGFSAKAISEHFLKKTISMGSAFMAIVITFSIIVIALYYLLNLNQYFLYKITN